MASNEIDSVMATAIITGIAKGVKQMFENEESGHDWWHIYRVWQTAKKLQSKEGGDLIVIEVAALVHDIGDHKLNKTNKSQSNLIADFLKPYNLPCQIETSVLKVVEEVSYKGAGVDTSCSTLEGKIVQDADRLDAIGAIGIARAFAYGGAKGRLLFDPEILPVRHSSFADYKNDKGHTINHFYEKLLLLKDRLQTITAREIAADRHEFMHEFLSSFFSEWGNCDNYTNPLRL